MDKIPNLEVYNKAMHKSMLDKIDFIDDLLQITDTLIDFGIDWKCLYILS